MDIKEGDKIKIIKNTGGPRFDKFIGDTFTVRRVTTGAAWLLLPGENRETYWTAEELELVEEIVEIVEEVKQRFPYAVGGVLQLSASFWKIVRYENEKYFIKGSYYSKQGAFDENHNDRIGDREVSVYEYKAEFMDNWTLDYFPPEVRPTKDDKPIMFFDEASTLTSWYLPKRSTLAQRLEAIRDRLND